MKLERIHLDSHALTSESHADRVKRTEHNAETADAVTFEKDGNNRNQRPPMYSRYKKREGDAEDAPAEETAVVATQADDAHVKPVDVLA